LLKKNSVVRHNKIGSQWQSVNAVEKWLDAEPAVSSRWPLAVALRRVGAFARPRSAAAIAEDNTA
jgi:hypothetical protein